jgi:hypothetical protein
MLTQRQIDEIINASRQADEGPTPLARRIEAAVMELVLKECEMATVHEGSWAGGRPCYEERLENVAIESLAGTLRTMWQDSLTPRPAKS